MARKVAGESGHSVGQTYQLPGGVIEIEDVATANVNLTHDLASTIFSERFRTQVFEIKSGAIAQSTSWNVTYTGLPATTTRILGVIVQSAGADKTTRATVSIYDADSGLDMPFFYWDITKDEEVGVIMSDSAGVAVQRVLQPVNSFIGMPLPSFGGGKLQPHGTARNLSFRGTTNSFGGGTVECTACLMIASSAVANVVSQGLPIPSW